jgi:hypothetical protein
MKALLSRNSRSSFHPLSVKERVQSRKKFFKPGRIPKAEKTKEMTSFSSNTHLEDKRKEKERKPKNVFRGGESILQLAYWSNCSRRRNPTEPLSPANH